MVEQETDDVIYEVVMNHEEQYSIWPQYKGDPPPGWAKVGKCGMKAECLEYVDAVWTDMRPLSLRIAMQQTDTQGEDLKSRRQDAAPAPPDPRDNLVQFLATGTHPVEVDLRPAVSLSEFQAAIQRGYVHIKFADTRGGTVLGVKLDKPEGVLESDAFVRGTGQVYLAGALCLNYTRVRCVAAIDLPTLRGQGHLEVIPES